MGFMKTGYIVKILADDNVGIIREEGTLTEWLYFVDENNESLRPQTQVTFIRNTDYEQFVAEEFTRVERSRSRLVV